MSLLSDELWLIANKPKSFAKGSKSIIRSSFTNICVVSTLKFTFYRTFKNIVKNFKVQKYIFAKERCIKQMNDIQEWQQTENKINSFSGFSL